MGVLRGRRCWRASGELGDARARCRLPPWCAGQSVSARRAKPGQARKQKALARESPSHDESRAHRCGDTET
eukprot:2757012-Rhodomonas_salina.2